LDYYEYPIGIKQKAEAEFSFENPLSKQLHQTMGKNLT